MTIGTRSRKCPLRLRGLKGFDTVAQFLRERRVCVNAAYRGLILLNEWSVGGGICKHTLTEVLKKLILQLT